MLCDRGDRSCMGAIARHVGGDRSCMVRRFCWSLCMVELRRRCAKEFDSVRRMHDDGRVQCGLGVLFGAIDLECVHSEELLVVDGLCPYGIPPLMEVIHSDCSGGGYDDRGEGSVESFAGLRMLSHLVGVLRFEGFEEDVALFAKVRG